MNSIISQVRSNNTFPEWYEGLHKALFRSSEFFGKIFFHFILINVLNIQFYTLDDRNVLKDEFVNMMLTWEINEEYGKTI